MRRWRLDVVAALGLLGLGLALAGLAAPGPAVPAVATNQGYAPPLATVRFLALPGHAVLITAGGHAALVDGGAVAAGPQLVSYLRGQGVERLDELFVTRPADDEVGGLIAVLEQLPVSRIFDGGWASDCSLYRSLLRLATQKGVAVEPARRGTEVRLTSLVHLSTLLPSTELGEEAPGAMALRLVAGETRFLLPGSLQPTDQERLLRLEGDLQAQVVELPSVGGLLPGLAEAVAPRLAVAAGPTADGRLAALGTGILRLDRLGTVSVSTDGVHLSVGFGPPVAAAAPGTQGGTHSLCPPAGE